MRFKFRSSKIFTDPGFCHKLKRIHTLAILLFCFLSQPALAVIGGNPIAPDSPLARVSVSISQTDLKTYCTGVLIDSNIVLTAAQCVKDVKPKNLFISFGDGNLPHTLYRGVLQIYIPTDFQPYSDQLPHTRNAKDIAFLVFTGSFPRGYQAAKIIQHPTLKPGETASIVGFGFNQMDGTGSGTLRTCNTTVQDMAFSESELSMAGFTATSTPCLPIAQDSGGALATISGTEVILHGLFIWSWEEWVGSPPFYKPQYSVFTRIDAYYPWIQILLLNH